MGHSSWSERERKKYIEETAIEGDRKTEGGKKKDRKRE